MSKINVTFPKYYENTHIFREIKDSLLAAEPHFYRNFLFPGGSRAIPNYIRAVNNLTKLI